MSKDIKKELIRLHICTQNPCPLRDKEAFDMLNAGFKTNSKETKKEISKCCGSERTKAWYPNGTNGFACIKCKSPFVARETTSQDSSITSSESLGNSEQLNTEELRETLAEIEHNQWVE